MYYLYNKFDKGAPRIQLEDILPPPRNASGFDRQLQQIGCSRTKASLQSDINR